MLRILLDTLEKNLVTAIISRCSLLVLGDFKVIRAHFGDIEDVACLQYRTTCEDRVLIIHHRKSHLGSNENVFGMFEYKQQLATVELARQCDGRTRVKKL